MLHSEREGGGETGLAHDDLNCCDPTLSFFTGRGCVSYPLLMSSRVIFSLNEPIFYALFQEGTSDPFH